MLTPEPLHNSAQDEAAKLTAELEARHARELQEVEERERQQQQQQGAGDKEEEGQAAAAEGAAEQLGGLGLGAEHGKVRGAGLGQDVGWPLRRCFTSRLSLPWSEAARSFTQCACAAG